MVEAQRAIRSHHLPALEAAVDHANAVIAPVCRNGDHEEGGLNITSAGSCGHRAKLPRAPEPRELAADGHLSDTRRREDASTPHA